MSIRTHSPTHTHIYIYIYIYMYVYGRMINKYLLPERSSGTGQAEGFDRFEPRLTALGTPEVQDPPRAEFEEVLDRYR